MRQWHLCQGFVRFCNEMTLTAADNRFRIKHRTTLTRVFDELAPVLCANRLRSVQTMTSTTSTALRNLPSCERPIGTLASTFVLSAIARAISALTDRKLAAARRRRKLTEVA